MKCRLINFENRTVIVCGGRPKRHSCYACGNFAEFQCDSPVFRNERRGSCDRWMCSRCRRNIGENTDLCRPHHELWESNGKRFVFGGGA